MSPVHFTIIWCHLLFSYCNSQFDIWSITLLESITWSGIGIYNDTFTSVNGKTDANNAVEGSYSLSLKPYSNSWDQHAFPIPFDASYISITPACYAQVNNLLYIVNPITSTRSYGQEMFIYDLSLNEYASSDEYLYTPLYRAHDPCVVHNDNYNIIYVIGGYYGQYLSYTQSYDITSNVWSTVSSIQIARNHAGCAIDDTYSFIFLFGGQTQTESYGSSGIEKYKITTDEWGVLTETLLQPTREFDCALYPYDAKIYCVGGRHYATYLNTIQIFNPMDYSIHTIYMNYGRQFASIVFWGNDCMLIVGGYLGSVTSVPPTDTIETYGNCQVATSNPTPTVTTFNAQTTIPTIETSTTYHPSDSALSHSTESKQTPSTFAASIGNTKTTTEYNDTVIYIILSITDSISIKDVVNTVNNTITEYLIDHSIMYPLEIDVIIGGTSTLTVVITISNQLDKDVINIKEIEDRTETDLDREYDGEIKVKDVTMDMNEDSVNKNNNKDDVQLWFILGLIALIVSVLLILCGIVVWFIKRGHHGIHGESSNNMRMNQFNGMEMVQKANRAQGEGAITAIGYDNQYVTQKYEDEGVMNGNEVKQQTLSSENIAADEFEVMGDDETVCATNHQ